MLALACLAPDIIERILCGKQPRRVTLDRLVRLELPMKWADQRALLGVGAAK
jgi:site-specific DNA recombinase